MCLEIKNHFLETPMKNPELMRVKCECMLEDTRKRFGLDLKVVHYDWMRVKIHKGVTGVK